MTLKSTDTPSLTDEKTLLASSSWLASVPVSVASSASSAA